MTTSRCPGDQTLPNKWSCSKLPPLGKTGQSKPISTGEQICGGRVGGALEPSGYQLVPSLQWKSPVSEKTVEQQTWTPVGGADPLWLVNSSPSVSRSRQEVNYETDHRNRIISGSKGLSLRMM